MQVSDLKLLLVGGLVAAAIVTERLLPLAALGILIIWAASALFTRRVGVRTPADIAILALVLLLPVSLWVSPLPEKSLLQIFRLVTGIALFYAVAEACVTLNRARLATALIALAGTGLAILSLFSLDWSVIKLGNVSTGLLERLSFRFADTIHPNVMAGNLLILLLPVIAVPFFQWHSLQRLERLLYPLAGGLMLVMLVLTEVRGPLLALFASIALLVLLRWRRGWVVVVAALVLGGVILWADGANRLVNYLVISPEGGNTWLGRSEIWSRALFMLRDFPYTGVGMGLFGDIADTLYPFIQYEAGTVPHAHNLYLQIAVDLGFFGLVAWLAVWICVLVICWQIYRRAQWSASHQGWVAALGAGLLASQVALGLNGLTDAVTWGMVRPAPLVWVLWGLAVASWNLAN